MKTMVKAGLAMVAAGALWVACGADSGPVEPTDLAFAVNEIDVNGRDWVEFVNISDGDVDMAGWVLSDGWDKEGHAYAIPAGSVLAPGAYLVVKEEKDPGDGTGFPFGFKSGETVHLRSPDGESEVSIKIGEVPADHTWGRIPDGTGQFRLTQPTQGHENQIPFDLVALLFDPGSVKTIELTIGQDGIAALGQSPFEHVEASVKLESGGQIHELGGIGVRLKGGLSFLPLPEKASFKLKFNKFDKGVRFLGLKNLTLNAMVDDPTMMRETLAYRLFRAFEVPAPRTGYARVRVNGEDFGLYVVVEAYDDVTMGRLFKDTEHLYEGSVDLFVGQVDQFEVDEGDATDIADLIALAQAADGSHGNPWLDDMAGLLDVAAFVRLWVLENYIGHGDGYAEASNNYFLHSDSSGLFTMLPWGTDRAFVSEPSFPAGSSRLVSRCEGAPDCMSQYAAALTILAGVVDLLSMDQAVSDLESTIGTHVEADPLRPDTMMEHPAAVQALKTYLEDRRQAIAE
ncbi:MAG: CotH kinase family protein [Deltaproteobacteria bacterium]|nr:CotH kinase family protein [Deltaproteobacteria bacterium]